MTTQPHAATVADLRPVDLFDDLGDTDLAAWAAATELRTAEPGEVLAEQGQPPTGMICLLEGTMANFVRANGHFEPAGRQLAPTWTGAIAVITEDDLGVRIAAETRCTVGIAPAEEFRRLVLQPPAVHRRIMRQVGPVMARITGYERNRERLASLG